MTNDIKEIKEEDLTKVLSEIDGLDKTTKEIYRVDSETFLFTNIEYKLIENFKEAFDIAMMEERYTDYLLKYDYIVGDIAYEKLRLRGFYDDHRKGIPIDMKISNLEDYLIEFCNFGSKYFVFERSVKKTSDPESYFKRSNKPSQNKRRNTGNKRTNPKQNAKPNPNAKPKANAKLKANTKPKANAKPNPNAKPKANQPNKSNKPNKPNPGQQTKAQNDKRQNSQNQTKPKQENRNPQNKNQPNKTQPNKAQSQKDQSIKPLMNKKQNDFQVVKKQEVKTTKITEQTKTVAIQKPTNNKRFKIRKKKTED